MHEMRTIRDAFISTDLSSGLIADLEHIPGFSPAYLRIANLLVSTNLYVRNMQCDSSKEFRTWDDEAGRGWRGPYVRFDRPGPDGSLIFPAPEYIAPGQSKTFADRGFFPSLSNLSLPHDYIAARAAYGFSGEPALFDPWGAPYILQIPPRQAFATAGVLDPITDEDRFRHARIVSAGPDGIISTPCYAVNTNASGSAWSQSMRTASQSAIPCDDDLVLFLFPQL